jgi:hypothetical protein
MTKDDNSMSSAGSIVNVILMCWMEGHLRDGKKNDFVMKDRKIRNQARDCRIEETAAEDAI